MGHNISLTEALSKTLMVEASAILFAVRACSSVHNGSLSHFPKITMSMSLMEEEKIINYLKISYAPNNGILRHFDYPRIQKGNL